MAKKLVSGGPVEAVQAVAQPWGRVSCSDWFDSFIREKSTAFFILNFYFFPSQFFSITSFLFYRWIREMLWGYIIWFVFEAWIAFTIFQTSGILPVLSVFWKITSNGSEIT